MRNLSQWVVGDSDEEFAARPSIKLVDKFGNIAIHWVLSNKDDTELLARLLHRKAVVDVPDKYGKYPIHLAAQYGSVTQLQMLKEAGATMLATVGKDPVLEAYGIGGWLGVTVLHIAASRDTIKC